MNINVEGMIIVKKMIFIVLILFPLLTFSDGGNPFLYCSSYNKYDVQPMIISEYELDAYSIKINGISQVMGKDSASININKLPYYKQLLLARDTMYILDMKINKANTEVICISMNGDFCKE